MVEKIEPSQAQDVWKDVGENVDFVSLELNRDDPEKAKEGIQEFADRSQAIIRSMRIRQPEADLRVSIGFSNNAWDFLFPNAHKPKELETFAGVKGPKYSMPATNGDLFLHIRAKNQAVVYEVVSQYRKFLKDFTKVLDEVKGFRYLEGRAIIGYIDGTEAPLVEDAAPYAIIGEEDPEFINGSYLFAQKWIHDMDFWNKMPTSHQDKAVGREKFTDLELEEDDKYENAHNLASNTGDDNKIVRMNVPFSDPASNKTGTYFMGYARHWSVTKGMLQQMVDMSDFLLTFSTLVTGTLYFIPSRPMLDAIAGGELNPEIENEDE
ncbi:Dyp-type peroxidase [Fructilactobacillus vespulae]|uniref:Dyp-type peroxidase n=1 Tax=Fructilactobacillus vespulae TaxID=1249630 RepID=UPI0039B6D0ED